MASVICAITNIVSITQFNRGLAGLLKIKLRSARLRVIYQLHCTENSMLVIVIGLRADGDSSIEATKDHYAIPSL